MHDEGTVAVFHELIVVAGISVLASLILSRLKLPIITILLVAGAAVGPYGFGLITEESHIQLYAEIGVILLLFTIGLEFSLKRLIKIGGLVSIGGSIQVLLTTAVVALIAIAFKETPEKGIFYGFAIALSSTAIVLRSLTERQEIDAPHGRFIVGTLIFQDLCIVPMILILPVLSGSSDSSPWLSTGIALGKAGLVVVLTLVISRWVVPKLFARVDRLHSREVFLLAVITICLGTAWLTSLFGVSLSLGAFLAGMILADTEYGHRAAADVLPIRDIFTSFFFVSIGMLFNTQFVIEHSWQILLLFLALLLGKAFIATLSGLVMRFPVQAAIIAGFGLAQFGEFGFVLVKAGERLNIIDTYESSILLNAGIITMVLTPIVMNMSPHLAAGANRLWRLEHLLGARGIDEPVPKHRTLSDHVVIVGFGVGGQVLARALKANGIPYLIIELDANRVRIARRRNEPVYYGDIATPEALANAHVREARGLALLINDPKAAERAIVFARRHAPLTPVFVRTKLLNQAEYLAKLGATEVIVEEVEAGLAMLAKVLKLTELERADRFELLQQARSDVRSSEIDFHN